MDSLNSDESLDLENTLWTNCVIASGQATGVVIYTGKFILLVFKSISFVT